MIKGSLSDHVTLFRGDALSVLTTLPAASAGAVLTDPPYSSGGLHPVHYMMYPVEPISICRHLGFCLGNVTKYTLRAPWKGGVEDCDKALEYLRYEQQKPQVRLDGHIHKKVEVRCLDLADWLEQQPGDDLWSDIAKEQSFFLKVLPSYIFYHNPDDRAPHMRALEMPIRNLSRILSLRDTTGQIYEGMTGLPQTQEGE